MFIVFCTQVQILHQSCTNCYDTRMSILEFDNADVRAALVSLVEISVSLAVVSD